MKTVISEIAKNCQWYKTVNDKFIDQCIDNLDKLRDLLPSGSGFDSGCEINIKESGEKKVVLNFSFHHMNENGYYIGWTEHKVILLPTFSGYDMKITGKDINQTKEYFYDTLGYALDVELPNGI
jgi:hypothetical protein